MQEVTAKLTDMPSIREEFSTICFDIMLKEAGDDGSGQDTEPADLSELDEFEDRWFKALTEFQTRLEQIQISSQPLPSSVTINSHQINVRLPVINLPEFSGSYTEWLPFHDSSHPR